MLPVPLTKTISTYLNCPENKLEEFLNNPAIKQLVERYLDGKLLRTTYKDRNGRCKEFKFGRLTDKTAATLYAYEGYLGWLSL
jgi:hypothetical protein